MYGDRNIEGAQVVIWSQHLECLQPPLSKNGSVRDSAVDTTSGSWRSPRTRAVRIEALSQGFGCATVVTGDRVRGEIHSGMRG